MSVEVLPLESVADVVMGQSPPGSSYNSEGNGLPFFQGKAEFTDVHPQVRKWTTEGSRRAEAGDILLSVRAPVGATNIANQTCVIGRGLAAIRAKERLDQRYLLLYLKATEEDLKAQGVGTTFDAITGKVLRQFQVPVPPLDEQKRIVAQLEDQLGKLEAVRVGLREVESLLDSFDRASLDSQIESAAGTPNVEHVPLGNLVHDVRRSVNPSDDTIYELWAVTAYVNGEPDVISGSEIKSSKLEVSPGDILLSKINPRINRVWKVKPSSLPQIASTEWLVCRLKDPDRIESDFLLRFLQSPRFRNWLTASASSVTGSHSRAKSKEILKQVVPVPPLDVQQRIADNLLEIEDAVQSIRRELGVSSRKLDSARSSILHRAFLPPGEGV